MNREGMFQPYFGLKLGPQYGQLKTVFNAFQETTNTWGFYMSPEIGVNIFPWVYKPGIHVSAYYSYATNKGKILNKRSISHSIFNNIADRLDGLNIPLSYM